jgi:hypothetical protein
LISDFLGEFDWVLSKLLVVEVFRKRFFQKCLIVGSIFTVSVFSGTGFSHLDVSLEPGAQISSLEISPDVSNAGVPVTIIVGVKNSGSESTEYSFPVVVQGIEEENIFGVLPPGGIRKHRVSIFRRNPGVYTVAVKELTGTFVINPAIFTEKLISISPLVVEPGSVVQVQGVITNVGGVSGVFETKLLLNGVAVGESSGALLPQESKLFDSEIFIKSPGIHMVSMGKSSLSLLSLPPLLEAKIPRSIPLSQRRTIALDSDGDVIALTGKVINILAGKGDGLTMEFPFKLPVGKSLGEFSDVATGVKFQDNELFLPLRLENGTGEVFLRASFKELLGNGNQIVGLTKNVWIEFNDITVNLEITDSEIGSILFGGRMVPETIPIGSTLQFKASALLEASLREKINQTLFNSGDQMGAMAVRLDVLLKETGEFLHLRSGLLEFSLSSDWIERFGPDSSVQLIVLNRGIPEIPRTQRKEYDSQNRLRFRTDFNGAITQFRIVTLIPQILSENAVVSSLDFHPEAVSPGDSVEIIGKFLETHIGKGVIPFFLFQEGVLLRAQMLPVDGKKSGSVRFFLKMMEQGKYLIELNGKSKELSAAYPLDARDVLVSSLISSVGTVSIGSPLSISMTVSNQGGNTGLALPVLRFNDVQNKVIPVVLGPGETREVDFTIVLKQPGPYRLEIDKIGTSIDVLPRPPERVLTVDEVEINPKVVDPGDSPVLQMRLTNHGYVETEFLGHVEIGNELISIGPIPVPALTSIITRKEFTLFESGVQEVSVYGHVFQLEVRKAKETRFKVSNLLVFPETSKRDRPISVSATLLNSLPILGKDEITLKVDGMIVSSEWAWLAAGKSKDVLFEISESELGIHSITLNGSESSFRVERMIPLIILIPVGIIGLLSGIVGVYFGRKYRVGLKSFFRHRQSTGN